MIPKFRVAFKNNILSEVGQYIPKSRIGGGMRLEKRSLAINEMKEALKSELVTKICGGRIWVVKTEKQEDENGNNLPVETRATDWGHNQVTKKRGKGKRDSQSV